jgi:hypothetical protein
VPRFLYFDGGGGDGEAAGVHLRPSRSPMQKLNQALRMHGRARCSSLHIGACIQRFKYAFSFTGAYSCIPLS